MALASIPLWTIRPNWSQPVVEVLEWMSAVLTSPTGAEQRMALRLSPRRSIEFTVTVRGAERAYLLGFIDKHGGSDFYLPLWHEIGLLTRSEHAGSLSATVDREMAELAASDAVCAALDVPYGWPIAEVSAGANTGGVTRLTLASPGWSAAVSKGARVYPMARARLDPSVSWDRHTDDSLTATVRMDLLGAQDWAGTPDETEYAGYPVIDLVPNEGRSQTGGSSRILLNMDNQTGARARLDTAERAFPSTGVGITRTHRGATDAVRSLLYSLQGRVGQAWFVSPFADFSLAAAVADADDQITVVRTGYTDFGGPTDDNDRIVVRMRDGTNYYRQITGAAVIDGGDTELLTLDSGFDLGFAPADVLRISLLLPGRLDQDRFELTHVTDTDGVCEVSLAVRRVAVIRSAADWDPPEFPDDGPV